MLNSLILNQLHYMVPKMKIIVVYFRLVLCALIHLAYQVMYRARAQTCTLITVNNGIVTPSKAQNNNNDQVRKLSSSSGDVFVASLSLLTLFYRKSLK